MCRLCFYLFKKRSQTDLLAAPDQRLCVLPALSSSTVHVGTGIDTHWCPFGHLRQQQWWRLGGSGRWPAGEVPAQESCCRWCWHPEPPPRTGPCQGKRDTASNRRSSAHRQTHTWTLLVFSTCQIKSILLLSCKVTETTSLFQKDYNISTQTFWRGLCYCWRQPNISA